MSIHLDDIQAASKRIAPIAHRTPVMTSRSFDRLTGVAAFFKCENLQRGGAFKIRGASNAIFSLTVEERARGVVTYSSGNHAQAVAIAAAHCGIAATIVMPDDAPRSKLDATRGYGAKVVLFDRLREDRVVIGQKIAAETGAAIIPPFDDPRIMAGQGTVALELMEQAQDLDSIVVCIGGGGLMSGCAVAAKQLRPDIRIFGVEPADGNDTFLSLQAGRRVSIDPPQTIADGLRAQAPGTLTLPLIQQYVEQVVLVSEDEIRAAMRFFLTRMKLVVEPSGAVAAAALMHGKLPAGLKRAGVVISGGNVDMEMLATL
ncbi:MAG: pyridoxal-phosphate dependent enzyme [Acidobacteriia bacterium]|nr:pyridoxal-phosphate dependent enzyme [Terriglobia bacterium]